MLKLPNVTSVVPLLLLLSTTAVAETNKPAVQAKVKAGWETVLWGKELDHAEYGKIFLAGGSTASGNPAALVTYTEYFLAETARALAADLQKEFLRKTLAHPGQVFRSGNWEFSSGVATYEHSAIAKIEVPDGLELRGTTLRVRTKTLTIMSNLPNTFQPYLRLRQIRPDSPSLKKS